LTATPSGLQNATTFTISNFVSHAGGTGVLTDFPALSQLGPLTINLNSPLKFGNAGFGEFLSPSVEVASSSPSFLHLMANGEWTPGTHGNAGTGPLEGGPFDAIFVIGFTQTGTNPVAGGSGSFAVSALEPSSLVMLLTGLADAGFAGRKRRS
jgi:hypothetical protein